MEKFLRRGVFLDLDSMHPADLDMSGLEACLADWRFHRATTVGQTAERVRSAELVVSNKVVLDRELLTANPQLRLICVAATGTNNVDLEAAAELGIAVTNVTRYATPSVVQHVLALMLSLTTRQREHATAALDGRWAEADQFCVLDFPFRELAGKILGIVGYGELGHGVARVAGALGMEVIISQRPGGAPKPGRVPFDEVLARSDVLTLHVPLAENTRDLIGAGQLARMKPDALLINAARGGIVVEQALADALRAGRLGGAGVDVLTQEPPVNGNPLLAGDIPNLIVTPHVAWASRESRQRLLDEIVENIRAFLAGESRNRLV